MSARDKPLPPKHGRDHRPIGWNGASDPGGADPFNWLTLPSSTNGNFTPSLFSGAGSIVGYDPTYLDVFGEFWQFENLVFYSGYIRFLTGWTSPGASQFLVSMPVDAGSSALPSGVATISGTYTAPSGSPPDVGYGPSQEMLMTVEAFLNPGDSHTYLRFRWLDTWPIGGSGFFGPEPYDAGTLSGNNGWTITPNTAGPGVTTGDTLFWFCEYVI